MSLLDRFRNDGTFAEGRRALDRGDLDAAIEAFERYVANDYGNASAWTNLGLAYKLKRQWHSSVRCNRHAAELDPTSKEAHWNVGVTPPSAALGIDQRSHSGISVRSPR